jgi:hypothetical protein
MYLLINNEANIYLDIILSKTNIHVSVIFFLTKFCPLLPRVIFYMFECGVLYSKQITLAK